MAFCRKIHHDIRLFFPEQLCHLLTVGNIPLDKPEVRIFQGRKQGLIISRIGQCIIADDFIIRSLFQHIVDEIAADKSGAAGYYYIHVSFSVNKVQAVHSFF